MAERGEIRVLVGVSTYDGHAYCRTQFIESLKRLSVGHEVYVVYNGKDMWGFEDFEIDTYLPVSDDERGLDIMRKKQNMIRDKFLAGDYTHLLMLESDNMPPANVIEMLSSHDRKIVSGMYFIKTVQEYAIQLSEASRKLMREKTGHNSESVMIVWQTAQPSFMSYFNGEIWTDNAIRMWTMDDWLRFRMEGKRLVPIQTAGVGCVLIHRDVLQDVKFNGGTGEWDQHLTDMVFYNEASRKGYSAFADIECIVDHWHIQQPDGGNNFNKWYDPKSLTEIHDPKAIDVARRKRYPKNKRFK